MANPFVRIEFQTRDLSKAKDFSSRLFDWKFEDIPAPGGDIQPMGRRETEKGVGTTA